MILECIKCIYIYIYIYIYILIYPRNKILINNYILTQGEINEDEKLL